MLLELPKEVLFDIIDFLAFQDRLNLVKTCRCLKNIISERCLYEELPIFNIGYKLGAALNVFRKNPLHGSQVKRITLRCYLYTVEILIELASVFPAIKEFRTVGAFEQGKEPKFEMLLPWKNTLEVVDVESEACIGYLLKDHLFSRLSSLTITIPSEHCQRNRKSDMVFQKNLQFFDCFKNTPSLRHLKLSGHSALDGKHLYVEHLEKLHEICPQLTSLCLAEMVLHAPDTGAMPLSIKPATRLLSLKFEKDALIYNARNAVLEYFIAKYTRLTEFAFLGSFSRDGRHQYGSGISSDELVAQRQWFISSLPATIKTLKLNTDGFDDPLGAIDKSELEPAELAFYHYDAGLYLSPSPVIKQPSDFRYLQPLNSLRSLTLEWNCDSEHSSAILGGVLHLNIRLWDTIYYDTTYHLADIISVYPSLKSLSVDHQNLFNRAIFWIGASDPSKKIAYANLRKLSINTRLFDTRNIEGIPTLFPNLKELELQFPFPHEYTDPDIVINLDGCDLDHLSLKALSIDDNHQILFYLQVKTFDTPKICRLRPEDSHRRNFMTEFITTITCTIKIICDNMKTLCIDDMDVKNFLNYDQYALEMEKLEKSRKSERVTSRFRSSRPLFPNPFMLGNNQ